MGLFICFRCDHSTDVDYTNEVVALILARGGSKGIPYKNLAKIDGVSMLGRALRIANNCNCFVEVWVSTDSEKIAREAYRHNVNVHYRSEYSARDEATSLESIQEFLNGHRHIKNIALIQCTSVFLSEQYLIAAVDTFTLSTHNIECVFSVYRLNTRHPNNCAFFNWIWSKKNDFFLISKTEAGNCDGNLMQIQSIWKPSISITTTPTTPRLARRISRNRNVLFV